MALPASQGYFSQPSRGVANGASMYDMESLEARLNELSNRLFTKSSDISVRITDVKPNQCASSTLYTRASDVETAIKSTPAKTRIRIISIYSGSSLEPLQITQPLMIKLLENYSIFPDFLQTLFAFGRKPDLAEACSSNVSVGDGELSYRFNYVEEVKRRDPWTFRHTAVYHKHRADTDIILILHPSPTTKSRLDSRILGLEAADQRNQPLIRSILQNPYHLHSLVLSSYLENWRWYMKYKGEQFSTESDLAMVAELNEADAQSYFAKVQSLRNMNDVLSHAKACCNSNKQLIKELLQPQGSSSISLELNAQLSNLNGFVESVTALQERTRNTLELIGYTLTLHNQMEAAQVNLQLVVVTQELKKLQQDTVDDSATVKTITLVSAFYLPGSFIATIFGMNFFDFNNDMNLLVISKNFWVFLALWLPLTVITAVAYLLVLFFSKRAKAERERIALRNVRRTNSAKV